MRLGGSLFLIAIGAILKFAVTDTVPHVDLGIVGLILIGVGIVGLIAEAITWGSRRRTTVLHAAAPPAHQTVVQPVVGQPVVRDPRY